MSIYADPVRQVQEDLYNQLLAIREDTACVIEAACEELSGAAPVEDPAEVAAIKADKVKLEYRVEHLKKALEKAEDRSELNRLEAENRKLEYRLNFLKKAYEAKE